MSTGHFNYLDKNGDLVQVNVLDKEIRVKSDSRGRYAEHVSGGWKVYLTAKKIEFASGDTYDIISMGRSKTTDPFGRKPARQ